MAALEELTVVFDADLKKLDREMQRAERRITRNFRDLEQNAARAGRTGGTGFADKFGRSTRRGMQRSVSQATAPLRKAEPEFAAAGQQAGSSYASGFGTSSSKRLRKQTQSATDSATRDVEGKFRKQGRKGGAGFSGGVGAGLGGLGVAFGGAVGVAAAGAGAIGASVLTASKDFEAAMNGVRAVTGATGSDFAALEAQAKELGSTTQFSATEAGQAMEFLGMAGFETTEIMGALPATLDLAAAGGLDLARSADIASNVLTGFGLAAEETQRVTDGMAEIASSANTSVGQLGSAFEQVGPIANSAGLSFEETTAALGLLANAGLQGEKGGTALRGALASLADASGPAQTELDKLGITVTKANGDMRPLVEIMEDFERAGLDMGTAVQIFGREAAPGFLSMLDQGSGALEDLTKNAEDAEGAAKKMGDIRMEGLTGAIKSAQSAIEGFLIALGDLGVLDAAAAVVDTFAGAVRSATGFITEHEAVIAPVVKVIGLLAAAFAGIIGTVFAVKGAIAGITAAIAAVKVAIAGVGAALAAATGPVGLTIAAIAALVVGLVAAFKKSETFREIVTRAFDKVKDVADGVRRFFARTIWPVLVEGFERLLKVARRVAAWFERSVFPALIDAARDFRDAAQPIVDRVIGWFRDLRKNGDAFRERWGFIWDQARERLDIFMDLARRVANNLIQQFKGWIDIITGLMSGDWGKVWDGALKVLKSGWDSLVAAGTAGIKLLFATLKLQFVQLPKAVAGWLADVVPVLVDKLPEWTARFVAWAVDMQRKLGRKLAGVLSDFAVWLATDVPEKISEQIGQWTDEFTAWAGNLWPKIKAELPVLVASLKNWISEQETEIAAQLQEWTSAFTAWAGGIWPRTKERIDGLGVSFTEWMEQVAEDLPENLEKWTDKIVGWIDKSAEDLPVRLEQWTTKFVTWVENFAEALPEKLEQWTDKFVQWAVGAPDKTVNKLDKEFEEAKGEEKIAQQIETTWGPRLVKALGKAVLAMVVAIPGMMARIGGALLAGFGKISVALAQDFIIKFGALMDILGQLWEDIKRLVIEKLVEMAAAIKKKSKEIVDDTVNKFTGLADKLVGNSVFPDMVRDIIGEVGKLPGSVDDKMGGTSSAAIANATAMSAGTIAQVSAMAQQLVARLVAMSAQVSSAVNALVTGFVAGFAQMGAQTQAAFAQMTQQLGRGAVTLATMLVQTFGRMGFEIVRGFRTTVTGVRREWLGLISATAEPVRYVIDPVVNRGLKPVWDTVAGKVDGLSPMPSVRGFEHGGTVDMRGGGTQPGYSAKDNRLAMFRDGEGVLIPEAVQALGGAAFIDAANRLGGAASKLLLEGFAGGGIVGLADRFKAQAKNDFDGPGGVIAAGARALNGMLSATGAVTGRGNDVPGAGYHEVRAMNGSIMDTIRKHKDDLEIGKGAKAVVKLAQKNVGRHPESNGNNVNAITDWYGMNGSPWCAMFISWLFSKTKNSKALKGASRTAWTGDYYTSGMRRVSEGSKKPADIAVYGTDHVNMVVDPTEFRIGGNEGDNVRKSRRSGGAIFRPAFRTGGMIDPAGFVHQDQGYESKPPDHIAALRDIFDQARTYDEGGYLQPGFTLAYNGTGAPEPVGAEPIKVVIELRGDDREALRRIRRNVRVQGGGNVQVAVTGGRR